MTRNPRSRPRNDDAMGARGDRARSKAAPRSRFVSPAERAVLSSLVRQHARSAPDAERAERALASYLEELLAWTRDSNLVAQNDLGRLVSRHVAESLAALPAVDAAHPKRLIDLGSGGGFPGLPLAILRPELEVTLVESRRRKGLFLQRVVGALGLGNLRILVERAERLGETWEEPVDVGTARAVAGIPELLPWLAPVVRSGGRAILFKGSSYAAELTAWAGGRDPQWTHLSTESDPDRHLHFLIFERTGVPAGHGDPI